MLDPTSAEKQLAFMLEKVDVRPIKELARRYFQFDSKFRLVVEAEPDWLPRHEVLGKIRPWDLLMTDELKR